MSIHYHHQGSHIPGAVVMACHVDQSWAWCRTSRLQSRGTDV